MYVHESLTSRGRYGLGDSRIADSVSQTAMRQFLTQSRDSLSRAFQQGSGAAPLVNDPGWGMFEPARASVEAVPTWVYYAGAGAVVVLVGALVYKKRKGR